VNATRYRHGIGVVVIFFVLFASMTFFRVRDYGEKSIDAQVVLKLLAVFVSIVVPVIAIISRKVMLKHQAHYIWLGFLLSFVVSSVYAPVIQVTAAGSIGLVGCFLFCIWMADEYGETTTVSFMILIVGFVATVSLIVYFVHPELGRMHAWLGRRFGASNRIMGIAGSPNGLGVMTSVGLVMTLLYFRRMSLRMRKAVLFAVIPTSICLIMTQNRMSFASLLVCSMIFIGRGRNKAPVFALMGFAGVAVVALVLLDPDTFLSMLSRSGDASEITSGTGRSMIWSVVLEHIAARPVLGYGYAAATSILPLDPRLFYAAAHCHNLYLEVMFSGGLLSFILFVIALFSTLYEGLKGRHFEPLLILAFFLLRGITEPSPFGGMPSFSAFAFFLSISFIIAGARQRERTGAISTSAADSIKRCRAHLHKAGRMA
jgi:O-antigen ligase